VSIDVLGSSPGEILHLPLDIRLRRSEGIVHLCRGQLSDLAQHVNQCVNLLCVVLDISCWKIGKFIKSTTSEVSESARRNINRKAFDNVSPRAAPELDGYIHL
jgi:hypothetical protein